MGPTCRRRLMTLGEAVPARQNLKSLTSMRAFAALLVFSYHLAIPALAPVASQGRVGVSFFFILSGSLLAWAWKPGEALGDFYRRRVSRIYPACVVALGAGAILSYSTANGARDPGSGVLAVLLLQSWVPDNGVISRGMASVGRSALRRSSIWCFRFLRPQS
ncbi:acyltransferase family protein [Arthrobacter sp. NA-172]|uniref:acyltransferase family protein n=1 Tax=Arthrobacter sp. NA-172 TaxID=3367524 RepID=UPI003754F062